MDPPVSDPSAPMHMFAATATALPPEDPPGTRAGSRGCFVGPYAEFSVDDPMANSSMFVLPRKTAPWVLSFAITVASFVAT